MDYSAISVDLFYSWEGEDAPDPMSVDYFIFTHATEVPCCGSYFWSIA